MSPTYAREITTPRYGMGMEQALAARGNAVHGILNGVDYEEWDPRARQIPADPFRRRRTWRARPSSSAISCCGRTCGRRRAACRCSASSAAWPSQKGFDLLIDTLPSCCTIT